MIHDNAPLRVFKISELTRVIAGQLMLNGQNSAVNLACTCRYLEEPVLSTLWERQESLSTLLKVLPNTDWCINGVGWGCTVRGLISWRGNRTLMLRSKFRIVGDPSPEAWNRVQRYASWMRWVRLEQGLALGEETFPKLYRNSPVGGWFPALRILFWRITKTNLSYVDLFFSPHLEKISICPSLSWHSSRAPQSIIPAIASTISTLPTSALQSIWVSPTMSWTYLRNPLSSVVLRCGPSLTEFTSTVPLSGAAVDHLIRLPYLRTCRIEGPPPSYSPSHSPLVFPPLTEFVVGKVTARGWLSLLEHLVHHAAPLSVVEESLRALDFPSSVIDAPFVSLIQTFRNLVNLKVGVNCHGDGGEDQCIFKLNNSNVTELAMALPRLEALLLGHPCSNNTCTTTAACSFLFLSIASGYRPWRYTSTRQTSSTISTASQRCPDPEV